MTGAAPPVANLLDLTGRVALVTAGSGGIGAGIARRLAEAGAAVVESIGTGGGRAVSARSSWPVMFMGLVPIMWSQGTGSDVMRRIAAPMIGGIFTSFLMELLVYPVIYEIWKAREVRGAARPAEA